MQHGRAKLTPFGRLPLVKRVECLGWSAAQAGEASACPGPPPRNGLEGSESRIRQVWAIALRSGGAARRRYTTSERAWGCGFSKQLQPRRAEALGRARSRPRTSCGKRALS